MIMEKKHLPAYHLREKNHQFVPKIGGFPDLNELVISNNASSQCPPEGHFGECTELVSLWESGPTRANKIHECMFL